MNSNSNPKCGVANTGGAPSTPDSSPLSGFARRDFLRLLGASGIAALTFRPWKNVMAGPFDRADFERLVPSDKKLSPEWLKSLTARGERTTYRGAELAKIGMPIGGVCAGQLYLGGDGKLWHWDIFNREVRTDAKHYAHPLPTSSPLDQGFALRVKTDGQTREWAMDAAHWPEVTFIGEYPIGYVTYADPECPLAVRLEAFSPFIPLNTDESSLPATVMEFTLQNTGAAGVEGELAGWLENAVCLYSGKGRDGLRRNQIVREPGLLFLNCSAENLPSDAPSDRPDFGTMGLALLNSRPDDLANTSLGTDGVPLGVFSASEGVVKPTTKKFSQKLAGSLTRKFKLAPGESLKVTFVLTWFMPNLKLNRLPPGRHYATKFNSAQAVAAYVATNFDRLAAQTRLWHDTWYDATLPFWFLDRTFLNTSTLATSTCYRFGNGRFYSWEGVGCCEGTCAHVWHYAQAVARVFPELERELREKVDLGLALQPDGAIHFRGEFNNIPAVDGQAGVILRSLREHQMSADAEFLKRNWPRIKKATEWLIAKDGDGDGLLESNQHNTLDTDWYGKVSWLSGLYLAALNAAATMADEAGDDKFAAQCRHILGLGQNNIVAQLFDTDYFVNKLDAKHLAAINSGTGCEIDQVMGQSWAFQVGLPRILPQKETLSALKSLWRYNFSPDVGPYRNAYKAGRWYAMPGEAGLLMCTFPRTDWDYAQARGKGGEWAAGYFNECMNGFEYQVAGHMLWEGMVTEGLAVTRAVHDRYHPSNRNPWNEVECGDHYVRSMASYGVYLAACGFEYHGPKAHLGFAPKLSPENFKCAFTSAEGWGSFSQQIAEGRLAAQVAVRWGKLRLKTLSLAIADGASTSTGKVLVGKTETRAELKIAGGRALITLAEEIQLQPENELHINLI